MISNIKLGKRQKVHYDISVIVLTYEQPVEKILLTLASVVDQKDINLQIIISDDGSENPYLQESMDFLEREGFKEYKAIYHSRNMGTVMNFNDALQAAEGDYIKSFGPGDCFSTEYAAKLWLNDIKDKKSKLSFCDAVYYKENQGEFESVVEVAHPQDIQAYSKATKLQKKYYLLYNDIFLAAAVLCERNLICNYLKAICNKVKYAEDNMFRLMFLDNVKCTYFVYTAIYYEWGSGVSTKESSDFQKAIKRDWDVTTEYICECCRNNYLENKIKGYYLPNNSPKTLINKVYQGLAKLDIYFHSNKKSAIKRLTTNGDLSYLYTLKNLLLKEGKESD